MIDPILMFKESGPFGYLLLVQATVAGVTGVLCVLGWGVKRRVPPALPLILLALGVLTALLGGSLGVSMAMNAMARASAEMKMTMVAMGVSVALNLSIMASLFLGTVAGGLAFGAGVVGALRGPRGFAVPGVALVLGLGVAGSVFAAGIASETIALRSVAVVLVGLPVLAALTARPPDDVDDSAGPLAAAAAASSWATMVVLLEVGARATSLLQVFQAVAHASAEMKHTMLQTGIEYAVAGDAFSWAAAAGATLIALLGAGIAMEDQKPLQNAGVLLGLFSVGAALALLAFDPVARAVDLMLVVF